ncbi:hypothetical protein LY90DRAFT_702876, partial [Neocallimastix californiae]
MAVEFSKLYSTRGNILYDEYFRLIKEEEDTRKQEHDAAALIQLTWHRYKEKKYRDLLKKSVIKIQKSYRGYISRVKTKERIIKENKLKRKKYYNEKAILIQKVWRGFHSRKEIFDFYAYKQYLRDVTDYTFKVNDDIKRKAKVQRQQMESAFLENEEKKLQELASKIHHVLSTKVNDGVCKYPHQLLHRMYREKIYENELRRVNIIPSQNTQNTQNTQNKSNLDRYTEKKIDFGSRLKPDRSVTSKTSLSSSILRNHLPPPTVSSSNNKTPLSPSKSHLNSKSPSSSPSQSPSQSQSQLQSQSKSLSKSHLNSQSQSQSQSQLQSPLQSQSKSQSRSQLKSRSRSQSKSQLKSQSPPHSRSHSRSQQNLSQLQYPQSVSYYRSRSFKSISPSKESLSLASQRGVNILSNNTSSMCITTTTDTPSSSSSSSPLSSPYKHYKIDEDHYAASLDTFGNQDHDENVNCQDQEQEPNQEPEQEQDIYTLNEKRFATLNLEDDNYTGYEFEHLTEILTKKEKLSLPISTIPESVIKNTKALSDWKKKNINRPRSSIPLQKEIIFKENIPNKYLKKKADGPFLPTYLLNRKLKGTKPEDLSLHNRITIDETQRRLKEEKIKNDNKILFEDFNLSQHLPPFKHQNLLNHNELWVKPKDLITILSEMSKFKGKHDFRARKTNLCYDAYKEDF